MRDHTEAMALKLAEKKKPQRCAECDCANGGDECNWITQEDGE